MHSGRPTASSQLRKVKVPDSEIGIFTLGDFARIIHAASSRLIPLLAISAFAGIRSAEIARLDWSAVDPGSLLQNRARHRIQKNWWF